MSQSPNPNPPPKKGPAETLEDAVYRPTLAEGNSSLKRSNPLVTIPATIAGYALFGGLALALATQTSAGKQAIKKTIGVDLTEEDKKDEEPPPPPPPPPPAPVARPVAPKMEVKENAPPPPPLDPNKDIVPDIAPRELPKQDLSLAYAAPAGSASGSGSGPVGAAIAGGGSAVGTAPVGASSSKVVDFDFSQIKIKVQPPQPPYPPLAKIAKIQGTVLVEITIGTDGTPTRATALDGPVQLRAYAEQYAMTWRFEPAMLNGVPQTAKFKLTLNFKLK